MANEIKYEGLNLKPFLRRLLKGDREIKDLFSKERLIALSKPFWSKGWLYASDGAMAIRIPCKNSPDMDLSHNERLLGAVEGLGWQDINCVPTKSLTEIKKDLNLNGEYVLVRDWQDNSPISVIPPFAIKRLSRLGYCSLKIEKSLPCGSNVPFQFMIKRRIMCQGIIAAATPLPSK